MVSITTLHIQSDTHLQIFNVVDSDRTPEHFPSPDEGLLDVEVHLAADPCPEVVAQLEGVLYGDAGREPHLLELGEVLALSDGDHQGPVVPGPGEEVQEVNRCRKCSLDIVTKLCLIINKYSKSGSR